MTQCNEKEFHRSVFILLTCISFSQEPYFSVPVIDLNDETFRQTVVDREDGQYLRHPTTVLLEDVKTIPADCLSDDEGKTWSAPKPLPNELNGDRHIMRYVPDSRLLVVFRDISPLRFRSDLDKLEKERGEVNLSEVVSSTDLGSPTEGNRVGWVGTWNDLVKLKDGQYRIKFKDNIYNWEFYYPKVELLPDGTFVVTTYGHWEKDNNLIF